MPARPTSSTTISFGLVSIPVKIYTATSSQSVQFRQLHGKCGGPLKQKLYCPVDDEYVERSELVKGFEVARNQYVQFSAEELRSLEAERFQTLDIVEFVPESSVDFVYIERSQYLGPDKGGHKAFNLLAKAMRRMERIAVGRYWVRGKVQLTLLRPYRKGLILHHVYYANEVRNYDEVELGDDVPVSPAEDGLADQLIDRLSVEGFDASRFKDEYGERVRKAAEQKASGAQVSASPTAPAAQIVDLFEALKQSLGAKPSTEAAQATGTEAGHGDVEVPTPEAKRRPRPRTTKPKPPRKAREK